MTLSSEDIENCLRVLQQVSEEPDLIGDNERMKGLIAKIYRGGRKGARRISQEAGRVDDKRLKARSAIVQAQLGLECPPALTDQSKPSLGMLKTAAHCYICKKAYHAVHPFYHMLCPECAALNIRKRVQRADLTGRTALVTGGRIKIGYQIALRLLRDGARVILTTRFPADAAQRFEAEPDQNQWQERLRIEGLDLRRIPAVEEFARDLLTTEAALDILVNNAAQTIKRPAAFYRHLLPAEQVRLLLEGVPECEPQVPETLPAPAEYFPLGCYDGHGQQLDLRPLNSWRLCLEEIDTVEMLEVHLVNAVAPFLLNARLKPLLMRSPFARRFIVNVSAMEGQFDRAGKTIYHPHTNMAKAALNMMTRTSAAGYAQDGIYMNSVDTGWVTDENPHPRKTRLQERGFWTPLDCLDGMARIYDPIVRGLTEEEPLFGHFLKDYAPCPW